jgi:hypothetical protein
MSSHKSLILIVFSACHFCDEERSSIIEVADAEQEDEPEIA